MSGTPHSPRLTSLISLKTPPACTFNFQFRCHLQKQVPYSPCCISEERLSVVKALLRVTLPVPSSKESSLGDLILSFCVKNQKHTAKYKDQPKETIHETSVSVYIQELQHLAMSFPSLKYLEANYRQHTLTPYLTGGKVHFI